MNTDTSTAQLVNQLSEQVSRLARDEIRLAVAELKDKGKHAGVGAGMFGAAGVFAWWGGLSVVAGLILLLALVVPRSEERRVGEEGSARRERHGARMTTEDTA